MIYLTEAQLNNLNKDALIILVSSLQDQMTSLHTQLEDNNRQIEQLIEQIKLMNQRQYGKRSESNLSENSGQLSVFDIFN